MKRRLCMSQPSSVLALVMLASVLLASLGCQREVKVAAKPASISLSDVEVSAQPVSQQGLAARLEFTGNLLPKRASRLTFEVDGIVANIPATGTKFDVTVEGKRYQEQLSLTYGQWVEAGELLVELDKSDFQLQLQLAEAKFAKAQADLANLMVGSRAEELRRLTALRNESRARAEQAERENRRMQELRGNQVVSSSEADQASTAAAAARALLESAEAMLASAEAGPTAEQIAVEQALVKQMAVEVELARHKLRKTQLVAPYSGVVVSINVEVGDRVAASTSPVIEMMNSQYLVAEINLPEALVGKVEVHDLAEVYTAGVEGPTTGLVVAVNEMVDPQSRSFRVRVAIDNDSRKFKAGQFAKVILSVESASSQSLTVPNSSIVFADGQPTVFVIEHGRVHRQVVQLGLSSGGWTEIRSGVAADRVVVTDDPTLLADGMHVRVRDSNWKTAARETAAEL